MMAIMGMAAVVIMGTAAVAMMDMAVAGATMVATTVMATMATAVMIMMTTTGISATPCSTIIDAGDGNRVTKQEARFRTEVSAIKPRRATERQNPLRAKRHERFWRRSVALRSR
jgi:hypothetical protein